MRSIARTACTLPSSVSAVGGFASVGATLTVWLLPGGAGAVVVVVDSVPSGLRVMTLLLRLRGSVMIFGMGRSSKSSATLVAACKAWSCQLGPSHCECRKLTSIQSTTSRAFSVCSKNCSPSARTRTTFLRFT